MRLLLASLLVAVAFAAEIPPPDAPQACAFIGAGGIMASPAIGNAVDIEDRITEGRRFNIPTDTYPSPLFNAKPFSQKLLLFEEFGKRDLDFSVGDNGDCGDCKPFPEPADEDSIPDSADLDAFLLQGINPLPREKSNTVWRNPWRELITEYIDNPSFDTMNAPAEGRPANDDWVHQRWEEFKPVEYITTAQTGARMNSGFRNEMQSHKYENGEFAPGGLYHQPTDGVKVQFHPDMPVQDEQSLWTFDGTFPPKLVMAVYGKPIVFRHYNGLPVNIHANKGFGIHTLSTHEHNGHSPAESDGFTNAFFFPGQFYDYRWPMGLAGHDLINVDGTDSRAAGPGGPDGMDNVLIPGDWRETMSTHWMHDHMLDFTAQNVYKGNLGMINFYSALDRGKEDHDDGVNMRFPSGTALPYGNRDYDVNLVFADKAFDQTGQLWYNPENLDGFLGDVMTVNLLYKPFMEVRARKYRFRLLNGAVSRFFQVAVTTENGGRVPFYMICNDGNIMEHTVFFEQAVLPPIGIGERYDIMIDFTRFVGENLYFTNVMEHRNGKGSNGRIDLNDVFEGGYEVTNDGFEYSGDPLVGPFLQLRVVAYEGTDYSMNPEHYLPTTNNTLIPLNYPTEEELRFARHRTFEYEKIEGELPWAIGVDGAEDALNTDVKQISAIPRHDTSEVWRLLNSGTWSHPIHIHAEEGIILRKDGRAPPEWERWARKDVFRVGPEPESARVIEILYRYRDFNGTYMNHCHNTLHEDKAMLIRYDTKNPEHLQELYAPVPCWNGGGFTNSFEVPTASSGDSPNANGPMIDPIHQWIPGFLHNVTFEGVSHHLRDIRPGDEFDPSFEERFRFDTILTEGVNVAADGTRTNVYFILHDISDEFLAEEFGIGWGALMKDGPEEASSEATYENGEWTFFGDLPQTVGAASDDIDNDYTSYRTVMIHGRKVWVNAMYVWWGEGEGEHLRIDENCVLPDYPVSTSCKYNGNIWTQDTGQVLSYNLNDSPPTVSMKIHKSYSDEGDYFPYYMVTDAFPSGPANGMGVISVKKHEFLANIAVPLIQFLPPRPLGPLYPPTENDGFGVWGGGPLGGQIGIPSYFMPGELYSPYWHIGFTHWKKRQDKIVAGFETLKYLREIGELEIREFPAAAAGRGVDELDDYDFENLHSPHVVNCPVPVTVDTITLLARLDQLLAGDLVNLRGEDGESGENGPPPPAEDGESGPPNNENGDNGNGNGNGEEGNGNGNGNGEEGEDNGPPNNESGSNSESGRPNNESGSGNGNGNGGKNNGGNNNGGNGGGSERGVYWSDWN